MNSNKDPYGLVQRETERLRLSRGIVWTLAIITLTSITAYVVLWSIGFSKDTEVDTGLLAIASAGVGALATSLTRSIER